ncbi:MAG: sugar ABC transporter permease [Anaerolineae bacterium]|nr:sugar ABC transporter permease [Anaerolineae bacterium]
MDTSRRYRLLLLPFVIATVVLVGVPAALAIGLSLTDYDALSTPNWVGFANYIQLLDDRVFGIALGNSIYFLALSVPLRLLGAFGLALWLGGERRGTGAYRAIVYLPTVIPDAATALMWLWIVNPLYGPINLLLKSLGLAQPAWLADQDSARFVFVMMACLQIGEGFVVALSGLKGIPRSYYQAAQADGAGALSLFRHVTLPLALPWIALVAVRDTIFALPWTFAVSSIMTGGDPFYTTLFLPLYARIQSVDYLKFGLGAAATTLMIVLAALALGLIGLAARRGWYADEI